MAQKERCTQDLNHRGKGRLAVLSPNQLQESITVSGSTDSQEQATYLVNRDLSPTAQLSVEIPLGLR